MRRKSKHKLSQRGNRTLQMAITMKTLHILTKVTDSTSFDSEMSYCSYSV